MALQRVRTRRGAATSESMRVEARATHRASQRPPRLLLTRWQRRTLKTIPCVRATCELRRRRRDGAVLYAGVLRGSRVRRRRRRLRRRRRRRIRGRRRLCASRFRAFCSRRAGRILSGTRIAIVVVNARACSSVLSSLSLSSWPFPFSGAFL
jgi:hypothetical protein